MNSKPKFKTTMAYGVVVIIPIAVIVIILIKLVEVLELVAKAIGLHSNFGAFVAIFLALVFVLVSCYAAGILVHTQIGSFSFDLIERKILLQIPGYRIISGVLKGFADDKIDSYKPALVQLGQPGVSSLAFIMEENDDHTVTVFVPSTPAVTVGAVFVVDRERVALLDTKHLDAVNCLTDWGMGSNKVVGKKVEIDQPLNE